MMKCVFDEAKAATEPMIRINGVTGVRCDSLTTLEDLFVVSEKFAKITQADKYTAIANLSTAVGDLSASVVRGDEPGGFAFEIANVLAALGVVAATVDTEFEYIYPQIGDVIADEVNKVVQDGVHAIMSRANAA